MKFSAFDLETTTTDVAKAEVVQAAVVSAPYVMETTQPERDWLRCAQCGVDTFHTYIGHGCDACCCVKCGKVDAGQHPPTSSRPSTGRVQLAEATSYSKLFHVPEIPTGAARVHKIKTEDVADCKPFARSVRRFVKSLTEPGVIAVSYNGCGYDIPVLVQYMLRLALAKAPKRPPPAQIEAKCEEIEQRIRKWHIDVMRLWWRLQNERPLAKCFAGTLSGAHLHLVGEMFDGAHDAAVDCTATLAVLDVMLREGWVDVETAIKWSNSSMPGDVDFAGKFKWEGDQVLLGFGKHKGEPLESKEVKGFLKWMLKPAQDFPADTKKIVTEFLAGQYPVREYENET